VADATQIIATLGLQPHPEGGWYRETWRDRPADGRRGAASSILFLLEAGQTSHWHRIDAAEVWLFQAGGPLRLRIAAAGALAERRLGPDILGGDLLQVCVEAGQWQSAEPLGGWTLVACVVAPAFEFATFELAAPRWTPTG
jgi:predicted cupin superfamily sugar epimerase